MYITPVSSEWAEATGTPWRHYLSDEGFIRWKPLSLWAPSRWKHWMFSGNSAKSPEKSVVELDCVVHRFVAVCSDKDIRMYAKADIVRFKDFLVDCPKYLTQDDLKKPVDFIMKKHRGTHYEKLSAKTIKSKYIGLLHAIFSYAVINDYCWENPVLNVRVLTSHNDEPKRLPFSIPQLKQITHSDLFTKYIDDKHIEYKFIICVSAPTCLFFNC